MKNYEEIGCGYSTLSARVSPIDSQWSRRNRHKYFNNISVRLVTTSSSPNFDTTCSRRNAATSGAWSSPEKSYGERMSVCASDGCSRPGRMQCPTCIKLGIKDIFFCDQECFKQFWKQHKSIHSISGSGSIPKVYCPWPEYPYSGLLRPHYPLSPKRHVPAHIQRPDYADHPEGVSACEKSTSGSTNIIQLCKEDIESMRTVCRLAREVLDIAVKAVRPGILTDELDRIVHEATIERDCYPSPLNYYNFPKSCCTSVNEIICHGIPDRRPLEDGDIVNLDITCYYKGFHGDLNETVFVGKPDKASIDLVCCSYACLALAIKEAKPGCRYREIGDVIQKHAIDKGCSVVRSYCGHGVHRLFHCAPNVPHYARNKAVGVMKPGHVFTIEPMINQGTCKDMTWLDDWTAVTADGKRSAQFEHTLLITDTGVEVLTLGQENGGLPHFVAQLEEFGFPVGDIIRI